MKDSNRSGLGRALLIACAALWVASLATMVIVYPQGAPTSADPGAPAIPIWVTLLPLAVGTGLILVLPWRPPELAVQVLRRDRLRLSTGLLVLLAIAFPAAVFFFGLLAEGYVLAKAALLMMLPAIVVTGLRPAVRIRAPRALWRWWAPVVVIIIWTWLSQAAPWNPTHDFSGIDTETLIVGALATAVTAGVGEELFYRRWLQTRLEAGFGPWPGIAVASVFFALMHLGSHGSGEPLLDVARVIVVQGSFGLFVGVMWWRYRNLTLIILTHIIVNGWAVAAYLLGGP